MRVSALVAASASLLASGCSASLTPSATPTLDTRGNVGFETRGDFRWGTGEYGRLEHTIGAGFGYEPEMGPYGLVVTAIGIALDYHREQPPMMGTLAWGPGVAIGEDEVRVSGRGILELFGLVAESKDGSHLFFLGPQLQGGAFPAEDEAGELEGRGLFGLGIALHWTFAGARPKKPSAPPPPPPPTPGAPPAVTPPVRATSP